VERARIGVIGAGWWAALNHIPLLKANPEVILTGICSLDPESLRQVQVTFDIPFATQDFRELLDHEPLDGVIVSSPHVYHYEHARAAILRRCHVLVEKPFTTEVSQARDLIQLERESDITIVIPFGYNFTEMAQYAADAVRAGRLGELQHAALHMATPTANLFLSRPLRASQGHLVQPNPSTWADPSGAGGFGWGQLSHALGLLFMLIEDEPAEVFALTGKASSGVDLHDAATMRFQSGATCTLSGTSGLDAASSSQLDLRLFGDRGQLSLDFEREQVVIQEAGTAGPAVKAWPGAGAYACERPVQFFIDTCLGRPGRNLAPSVVGCRSTAVLSAMYRSAMSGRLEKVQV
jgi:predicted dehydrogenase